ncbi:MAG: protein tlpB [Fluviicola sp.]|nr:protein tlpB [Fluviicola sp.]MBP6272158.1 protein tlpB [Fluviicola sp.]
MESTELQAKNTHSKIEWSLRIIVSLLFLVSALAKLYPSPFLALTTFEIKQLVPMGFSQDFGAWFSRTLIGCEFALGILMLQQNFYKRLIIPATALLLLIFCFQLSYEIIATGNKGNCGCFGTLLPMTPLQALIKNIVAIGILTYLFGIATKHNDKRNWWVLSTVTFACIMTVFMVGMKPASTVKTLDNEEVSIDTTVIKKPVIIDAISTINTKTIDTVVLKKEEPKQAKSGFANVYPSIDKGRKILCFFAPGCEHCKETAKQLTQLKNQIKDFPEINIAFMEEEVELIPDFFAFAGKKYTNKVLDIATFWTVIGNRDTPAVFYIWNGNIIKEYNGINEKAFSKAAFKKIVQADYSSLKK